MLAAWQPVYWTIWLIDWLTVICFCPYWRFTRQINAHSRRPISLHDHEPNVTPITPLAYTLGSCCTFGAAKMVVMDGLALAQFPLCWTKFNNHHYRPTASVSTTQYRKCQCVIMFRGINMWGNKIGICWWNTDDMLSQFIKLPV